MPDLTPPGFTDRSFAFFEGLAAHNDREWVHANADILEDAVDAPFVEVLAALSDRLGDAEVALRGSRDTMFRLNRDLRFTKDKAPYNTHRGALLTPTGAKDEDGPLRYLHLDAGGGFAFCGWHAMEAGELEPMRRRILDRAEAFDDVLATLRDAGLDLDRDDALKSMPRGLKGEAAHRHAEVMKLKSLGTRRALPKVAWTSGDVIDRVERMARATMPLLAFLR